MFAVTVYQKVFYDAAKTKWALLKREVDLPFAPLIGLVLSQGRWLTEPIEAVSWSIDGKRFYCVVKPFVPEPIDSFRYGEDVSFWLSQGWNLNAPPEGQELP